MSLTDLEQALSLERFARYLAWAGGDRDRAIELYTLNTIISESFYCSLQMLEVALRNRIHAVMTAARHDKWFCDGGFLLGDQQSSQVEKAIADITESGRDPTPGRVVAELTFSFWTAMFGNDYETLWQQTLHKIASRSDGKGFSRKHFSRPLTPIRTLRNRIAHHEPIIMWNLGKHHGNICQLTEWLSPAAAAWCKEIDRFPSVYPEERITLTREQKGDEKPAANGAETTV